ncbi:4a-hydroxytetrahydrobiopterin dehydratase [Mumia sp. zg.B21]|uniref:VOC family protein n=1 Tax=Mumia sp. zg.B21 TaxID=2855447 RepID=UPI001C6ECCFF|nr:VOC family protein [Mumia sp. zg.B21]MBW9209873.1 4a-hydroxytetrahydrobiopterin dehydratase [Mumia sp. zg.B21]
MSIETLTGQRVADEKLDGWVYLLGGLQTRIRVPDFAAALRVANAIGAAAGSTHHDPDLDLRPTHVDVRLTHHAAGGVTRVDVDLARRISAVVADADDDVSLEPATVSRIELALDSPAYGEVLPFWRAALAMEESPVPEVDDEIRDQHRALPTVWFQPSGSEEPRQRWHLDVWVPPDQVQSRIDAALAAGGTVASDDEAPSFWVLADPEGNKVCLCTWQDRD